MPDGAPPPPPGPTGPVSGAFAEPRALHPLSVVLGIPLMQLAQALLFPTAATFAAGGRRVALVVLVGGLVVMLVVRVLAWQRFRFSFDGEVLRVDSGVLSRNHRSLHVDRIQQVELDRPWLARLVGLSALRIETAGGTADPQVELRVLHHEEALALRDAVRAGKVRTIAHTDAGEPTPADAPSPVAILRVPLRHVVLAAVTGAQLLVFPALLGGATQFVGAQLGELIESAIEWLPTRDWEGLRQLGATAIVAVVAGAVLASVAVAIAVSVLRDANFSIDRVGDDLVVRRGLLSTRESIVPLRRVQVVQVRRNAIRRPLGMAAVRIHSAGSSAGGDRRVAVPLLPASDVDGLLSQVLPGATGIPPLVPHPPAARRRALWRWLRPAMVLALVAWLGPELVTWEPSALRATLRTVSLAWLPAAALLAIVEYRQLAHGMTGHVLAARSGALSVTTSLAPLVKVQAVRSRASFFQRRLGLATVAAPIAGPGSDVEVLDAGAADADALRRRLTVHAASSVTPPGAPAAPPAPTPPGVRPPEAG